MGMQIDDPELRPIADTLDKAYEALGDGQGRSVEMTPTIQNFGAFVETRKRDPSLDAGPWRLLANDWLAYATGHGTRPPSAPPASSSAGLLILAAAAVAAFLLFRK